MIVDYAPVALSFMFHGLNCYHTVKIYRWHHTIQVDSWCWRQISWCRKISWCWNHWKTITLVQGYCHKAIATNAPRLLLCFVCCCVGQASLSLLSSLLFALASKSSSARISRSRNHGGVTHGLLCFIGSQLSHNTFTDSFFLLRTVGQKSNVML